MKHTILALVLSAVMALGIAGWGTRPTTHELPLDDPSFPEIKAPKRRFYVEPKSSPPAQSYPATSLGPSEKPFNRVFIHVPPKAAAQQAVQVVVVLHGIGGEGKGFAAPLIAEADRNGWILVAPTIQYRDWHNPTEVAAEDVENSSRLVATLDTLSVQTGLRIQPKVHLYGFSRGAQFAHRFAIFFPERVNRVVAISAGTYTLPYKTADVDGDGQPDELVLPYGVRDMTTRLGRSLDRAQLKQVQFWIGVGGSDNSANDVPRAWDPYVGRTRVERAREFDSVLQKQGVHCSLHVFPGVGHEVTPQMVSEAVAFLANHAAHTLNPLIK